MFFFVKVGSHELLAEVVGYQVEIPAISAENVMEGDISRQMFTEFRLDRLDTVDPTLPFVDEVTDGSFRYFLPEANFSIVNSIDEVADVFLPLFGIAFFNENSIDVLRVRLPLILIISMDEPRISLCSMADPFDIMTRHDNYIFYFEGIY